MMECFSRKVQPGKSGYVLSDQGVVVACNEENPEKEYCQNRARKQRNVTDTTRKIWEMRKNSNAMFLMGRIDKIVASVSATRLSAPARIQL